MPATDRGAVSREDVQPAEDDTQRSPRALVSTDHSTRRREFFHAVARLGSQAAEALEHAHAMGVVHRDIKPSNLIVNSRGHLWITDFGLALLRDLIDEAPDIREYREERARGHRGLGLVLHDAERPEEAEEAFQAAIAARETLAAKFPSVPLNRFSLAVGRQNLGRLYLDTGRDAEAKELYSQAIGDLETLTDQFPADAGWRRELAELLRDCPIDELREPERAARLTEEAEKHRANSAAPEHTLRPGEVRPAGAAGSLSDNDSRPEAEHKTNRATDSEN